MSIWCIFSYVQCKHLCVPNTWNLSLYYICISVVFCLLLFVISVQSLPPLHDPQALLSTVPELISLLPKLILISNHWIKPPHELSSNHSGCCGHPPNVTADFYDVHSIWKFLLQPTNNNLRKNLMNFPVKQSHPWRLRKTTLCWQRRASANWFEDWDARILHISYPGRWRKQ